MLLKFPTFVPTRPKIIVDNQMVVTTRVHNTKKAFFVNRLEMSLYTECLLTVLQFDTLSLYYELW